MSDSRHRRLPEGIWTAFFGLLLVGVVVGGLSGAGTVGGLVLVVVLFVGLAIFVPWAVLKLDPQGISELEIYRRGQDKVEE